MAAKADKRDEPTIEDIARSEAEAEKDRVKRQDDYLKGAERLAKEVPARFFTLATELRDQVRRFNEAADPQKRLTWRESAALATRDANLSGDFHCGFSRLGVDINLTLTEMSRSGANRPNVYLIDATGQLRDTSFILRIEGAPESTDNKTGYRLWLDLRRLTYPIDELAERLVRAAVTVSYLALV